MDSCSLCCTDRSSSTFCKEKLAKIKIVNAYLTLGRQNGKSVNHYKNLGIVPDTELSDDKDIQRQLR